jgi:hypothetical protein
MYFNVELHVTVAMRCGGDLPTLMEPTPAQFNAGTLQRVYAFEPNAVRAGAPAPTKNEVYR